jgi:dihydrofolate synthase/folylpolyglutamate synthase
VHPSTFPIFHIAGTKGKGSTAAMLAAMLSAAGRSTGLFTSPHLDRLEERMTVDGRCCAPEEFVELVDRIKPVVVEMDREAAAAGESGPTYFELTTAMALLHFARRNVAAAVLEVGLGGRLDATNVCRPCVAVITSISLDHTQQLGDTPAAIAGEKAGIIKPGVPVVSGVTDDEPREVIRRVCRERGCRLVELGVDFDFRYRPPQHLERAPACGRLDFSYRAGGRQWTLDDVPLALPGRHQAANAAVALAALAVVGPVFNRPTSGDDLESRPTFDAESRPAYWDSAIRSALANLAWPARVEVISRRPAVVLDTAHNAASVAALVRTLEESFSVERQLLLFATTRDKDLRGMLQCLLGRFDAVAFTRYVENSRSVPPEELAALAKELSGRDYPVFPNPATAWAAVRPQAGPNDLICIAGSFYLAGEMRRMWAGMLE